MKNLFLLSYSHKLQSNVRSFNGNGNGLLVEYCTLAFVRPFHIQVKYLNVIAPSQSL